VPLVDEHKHLRGGYESSARFYDLFAENDDIPFYTELAMQYGSPVLDLAAGTGRVAIPLVRAGFEVTALEKSQSMLSVLRSKRESLPTNSRERLQVIEGDMTSFHLGQRFSLILIPASFGHAMTTDEQLSLLSCVREHLRPEGIFVLDLFPGGAMPEHAVFEEGPVTLSDGTKVYRHGVIDCDLVRQILTLRETFTVVPPGRQKPEGTTIEVVSGAAILFNREVDLLIRMSRLRVRGEYGGFDGRPYTSECGRRILLLAPK